MPDDYSALTKITSPPPTTGTIFHYTSQEGLLGIIREKALWLSSILHLSDATEFGYAVELARTDLNRRLRAERGPWNSYYGATLDRLDAIKDIALFVGSFSEQGDLLSQWRAYTPHGIGFSVGFEFDHLKKMAQQQGLSVIRCVYNPDEHNEILDNLIRLSGSLVKDGEYENAVTAFFIGLFRFAPALKHPSFFEEQEWRIVTNVTQSTDPKTHFRAGKSMLIPYQHLRLAGDNQKMPIRRLIVGPTPHMALSVASLISLLLTSQNIDPAFAVVPSRVPYRSW